METKFKSKPAELRALPNPEDVARFAAGAETRAIDAAAIVNKDPALPIQSAGTSTTKTPKHFRESISASMTTNENYYAYWRKPINDLFNKLSNGFSFLPRKLPPNCLTNKKVRADFFPPRFQLLTAEK